MATTTKRVTPSEGVTLAGVTWPAIIAGAVCASALAFVLHSFAAAIGLSLSSTAPTWRDASWALVLISGLYIILVALVSFGFGAYVTARMQPPVAGGGEETEFRDGMHGLIMWALATLITAMFAVAMLQALPRLAAPSGGGSGASASVAGETVIAYELDRLFRGEASRQEGAQDDRAPRRAEAARILFTTSGHEGMQGDDRTYLVRLVGSATGLDQPAAERRVDAVAAQAKDSIQRARRVAVIMGFMLGAAALLGAAAAWFAGIAAGRHRDGAETLHPLWDWGRPVAR